MLTKARIGAGFALAAAVVVGCSDSATRVTKSGELDESNTFDGASSIQENNLSQDRGGFSDNNQNWISARCVYNVRQPNSESKNGDADGSAMMLFTTSSNSNSVVRVYASHFNGTFTPPQEISGVDREENITNGSVLATNTSAAVLIPLNTSSYASPTTTSNAADGLVRGNSGNWLLLWNAQTHTNHPLLSGGDNTNGKARADQNGSHQTVYATMFIKSLRGQAIATTKLIGDDPATAAVDGSPQEVRYGFQQVASEITKDRGGASDGMFANVGGPAEGFARRPAEDIISFGAATDTFVGGASFSCSKNDPTGLTNGGSVGEVGGGFVSGPTTNTGGSVGGAAGKSTPSDASYTCGDNTTFIQLFWVQLMTSHNNNTASSLPTNTGSFQATSSSVATTLVGPCYRMLTANFDLASMSIKNQKIVPFKAVRNGTSGVPATDQSASAQAMPNFATYNQLVFWNYKDGSMNRNSSGIAGTRAGVGEVSQVLNVIRVNASAAGQADIDTTNNFDVTRIGTTTTHSTSISVASGGIQVASETVGLVNCNGVTGGSGTSGSLFGPDEGMGDVTAFVTAKSSSNVTASNTDTDAQVCVIAVNPTTGVAVGGADSTGGNLKRISTHAQNHFNGSEATFVKDDLKDDCFDIKTQIARNGSYIVIGWRQLQGFSNDCTLDLMAQVYKPFRSGVAQSSTGTVTATPTTLDQRLPTANTVTRVSTGAGTNVAYTNGGTLNGLKGVPVAAWDFQGGIGYRCGFQSDIKTMTVLYLYSDNTEDLLFGRPLKMDVGTSATTNPTITAGTEGQFDAGESVSGPQANNLLTTFLGNATRTTQSKFTFLPHSHSASMDVGGFTAAITGLGRAVGPVDSQGCTSLSDGGNDKIQSIDGPDDTAGKILVVFEKVTDYSTDDGSFFDRKVIATRFGGGNPTERAVISRNANEGAVLVSNNVASAVTGFKTSLYGIVGHSTGTSLTPNYPSSTVLDAGDFIAANGLYIYMSGPINDNASSPKGVFTRKFSILTGNTAASTGKTFVQLFNPAVGTSGATNTTNASVSAAKTAGFLDPTRLDRDLNADASLEFLTKAGQRAQAFMIQDNHIWVSETNDGVSYTTDNGASRPKLLDNNTSQNNTLRKISLETCDKTDSNCDNRQGTILRIIKDDSHQDQRAFIRVLR